MGFNSGFKWLIQCMLLFNHVLLFANAQPFIYLRNKFSFSVQHFDMHKEIAIKMQQFIKIYYSMFV